MRQIILIRTSIDKDSWLTVQEDLIKKSWIPVAVDTEDATYDLFEHAHPEGHKEEIKALVDFENEALQKGRGITVYIFPADFASKMLKNTKIKFWANAVDKAQENFCLLSMMADADKLKLSFTCPLLVRKAALKYGEKIKR